MAQKKTALCRLTKRKLNKPICCQGNSLSDLHGLETTQLTQHYKYLAGLTIWRPDLVVYAGAGVVDGDDGGGSPGEGGAIEALPGGC